MNETVQKVIDALRKNRMMAEYVPSKEDVVPLIKILLQEGCTIGTGGSRTLDETGVTEYLRNGNYEFYDRNNPAIMRFLRKASITFCTVSFKKGTTIIP